MDGTIAEIRLFAGNFAPRNWAFCNGQLLSIASNTALFALLGTTYGGNGSTTFALPDFRGRVPVGTGQGAGLSNITLGEVSGTPTVTLLTTQMPAHTHTLSGTLAMGAKNGAGDSISPTGNYPAQGAANAYSTTQDAQMAPLAGTLTAGVSGGSQPFNIMPPYLGMNFVICMFGIFPSRN